MLYHLLYPLREYFFGFNVFRYITFRSAYATVTALLICFIFGPRLIRWLSWLQAGKVRENVPERHNGKTKRHPLCFRKTIGYIQPLYDR